MFLGVAAALAFELPTVVYDGGWPRLAPDGARIAWLAGTAAPRTLCVATVAAPTKCTPGPAVDGFAWVDGATLVAGGATEWTVIDAATGAIRPLPAPAGSTVARAGGGTLLVRQPDGTLAQVTPDGEVRATWSGVEPTDQPLADATGALVGTLRFVGGASPDRVELRDLRGRRLVTAAFWSGGEPGAWLPASRRTVDGAVYAVARGVGAHGAIERVDLATGAVRTIYRAHRGQLDDVLLGPDGAPDAVGLTWDITTWEVLDPGVAPDLVWLDSNTPGPYRVEERSEDDRRWLLSISPGDRPAYAALYDRAARTLTRVPPFVGAAEDAPWASTARLTVATRDGFPITAYLTRPDPVHFPGPRPLIVQIHGGPWGSRYRWGFDAEAQRLAARGWASLKVNFRGSGGHGSEFRAAGYRTFTTGMRTDVYDAIASAVETGAIDPARVALVGGSYGGYAVIAASITAPEIAHCGVAMAAPVRTWAAGLSFPYWAHILTHLRAAQLAERAEEVGFPLLVMNGDRDRLVPHVATLRFAERAVAAGRPLTFGTLRGEGHDTSAAAWAAMQPVIDTFLARCFGEASTLSVPRDPLQVEIDGAEVFAR